MFADDSALLATGDSTNEAITSYKKQLINSPPEHVTGE